MGKSISWTIEKMKKGFERFHVEHGRYPTATEIDAAPYLPSSRQIQRRFPGGLPALRASLKLSGQTDFSKGAYSSHRAKTINERAHRVEQEVYTYLVKRFGKPFVHREYFFTDDRRTRTDFYVYCDAPFCVDVFYPKDKINFLGCVNNKLRTYSSALMLQTPVIFLMMNDALSGEVVDQTIAHKKNKLPPSQQVMTFAQFTSYCAQKKPLRNSLER